MAELNVRGRVNRLLRSLDDLATSEIETGVFRRALCEAKLALFESLRVQPRSDGAAQLLTLKLLNLVAGKRDLARASPRVESKPLGLIVDPSNGCHLACPGCVHSKHVKKLGVFDWSPGLMPYETMQHLLNCFGPFAAQVSFYNYGEPLLNPRTPEYIKMAKRMLAAVALSTNLSLKKFDAEAYVLSGLDFMILSIDGATPDTYARFRRGGDLRLVLSNVERLVDAKQKLGRHTPIINWQFLLFEHNRHEADRAVELARSMGVNQITLGVPFSVSWDDPKIEVAATEEDREIIFDADWDTVSANSRCFEEEVPVSVVEQAFELAWSDEATCEPDLPPGADAPCHWLYKNMVVDARGRVMPCCAPPARDYDIIFSELNSDATDRNVFNSEKYVAARLAFRNHVAFVQELSRLGLERPPHCINCTWPQGRQDVNIKSERVVRHLQQCTDGLLDAQSCQQLGDW